MTREYLTAEADGTRVNILAEQVYVRLSDMSIFLGHERGMLHRAHGLMHKAALTHPAIKRYAEAAGS
jgi:hypothetical protein